MVYLSVKELTGNRIFRRDVYLSSDQPALSKLSQDTVFYNDRYSSYLAVKQGRDCWLRSGGEARRRIPVSAAAAAPAEVAARRPAVAARPPSAVAADTGRAAARWAAGKQARRAAAAVRHPSQRRRCHRQIRRLYGPGRARRCADRLGVRRAGRSAAESRRRRRQLVSRGFERVGQPARIQPPFGGGD
jgi:hypothetical protein